MLPSPKYKLVQRYIRKKKKKKKLVIFKSPFGQPDIENVVAPM